MHINDNPVGVKLTCYMNQPDVYLDKSGVDYDGSILGYPAYVINSHIGNMPSSGYTQSDSTLVQLEPPKKLESDYALTLVSYPRAKYEKYF